MDITSKNSEFLQRCKNTQCFKLIFNEEDLLKTSYVSCHQYFNYFWNIYEKYKSQFKQINNRDINNTYNGQAFSIIITYLITREGIEIFAMDEDIGVPFVKPDIVIKKQDKQMIFLSLKTSLRERWKQADWEAIKFKKKYKGAFCYLLSNNFSEIKNIKKNLHWLDLDNIYNTSEVDLNHLFNEIKK